MERASGSRSQRVRLQVVAVVAAALFAHTPRPAAALDKIIISLTTDGVVAGIPTQKQDLLLCDPVSLGAGTTTCNWSLLFDASAAGLSTNVVGADMLPNGSLVLRVEADSPVPDIQVLKAKDLGLFIPDDPNTLPYTSGEWKLFLDGDVVTDSRQWNSVAVLIDGSCEHDDPMTCDVLLSMPNGSPLGGVPVVNEDILACTPTAHSGGGAITACAWSHFLDSSAINGGGSGAFTGALDAFELFGSPVPAMVFATGAEATLPPHEAQRDLLHYLGTYGTTPAGTTTFFFDGGGVGGAGLDGLGIDAVAIVPDQDGDGAPDGSDNCPTVPNPGQEDGDGDDVGDACDICPGDADPGQQNSDGDAFGDACDNCPLDTNPGQDDADSDDIGDVCDYCPFLDNPFCRCGDGTVDAPSEACDLGDAFNGEPGQPCTASCEIAGHCTVSGTLCDEASDCPSGQGCCGNAIRENDEQCDDGNGIEDDICDNSCVFSAGGVPIVGCEDLSGRHILPMFVKTAVFKNTTAVAGPGYDRWKSRGDFNLADNVTVDPDSEVVTVIFNQEGPGALYSGALPIASFVEFPKPKVTKWKFLDKEADVPGGEGLRRLTFVRKFNKVKNAIQGKGVAFPIDPLALAAPPVRLRQSIRIGNDCATTIITCVERVPGELLKCNSTPPPTTTTTTTSTTSTTL